MNNILKRTFFLLALNINLYSCTEPIISTSIMDAYVKIDAKKSTTSFNIIWKFKKDFIASLDHYDKNKNGKFDKDEQKNIKKDFEGYVAKNGYLTDVVYIKKGLKIKKSEIRELNIIDSGMKFSNGDIEYYFNFDMDFIFEDNHRFYLRFFDIKSNINISLKDIVLNNYSGIKTIEPQNSRANIYFYKHIPEDKCKIKEHKHHEK